MWRVQTNALKREEERKQIVEETLAKLRAEREDRLRKRTAADPKPAPQVPFFALRLASHKQVSLLGFPKLSGVCLAVGTAVECCWRGAGQQQGRGGGGAQAFTARGGEVRGPLLPPDPCRILS